jgi:hypothetical protein
VRASALNVSASTDLRFEHFVGPCVLWEFNIAPTKEGESDVLGCSFRTQVALKRAIETFDRHLSMLEPTNDQKKSESASIFNNSLL